jgi:hypothetical protein
VVSKAASATIKERCGIPPPKLRGDRAKTLYAQNQGSTLDLRSDICVLQLK